MSPATGGYSAISSQFYGNRLLFGDSADRHIVAIEIASPTEVAVFKRGPGDQLERECRSIRLFALTADRKLLADLRAPHEITRLAGDFYLRYLATFPSL